MLGALSLIPQFECIDKEIPIKIPTPLPDPQPETEGITGSLSFPTQEWLYLLPAAAAPELQGPPGLFVGTTAGVP